MTTEEKAKAYDKALERARYALNDGTISSNTIAYLQDIFPELKESEDERIIKAQLDYWRSVGGKEWHGVPVQETIAWLEKQGKKPQLSAADRGIIDEIIFALNSLGKEKMISYHKEIEFLNKIRKL